MTSGVPVIWGLHPDPTICRVDDVFYAAFSSFEIFPGIPGLNADANNGV